MRSRSVRRSEELEQDRCAGRLGRERLEIERLRIGPDALDAIARRLVREGSPGDLADDIACRAASNQLAVGDLADRGRLELVARKDPLHIVDGVRPDDDEHPFLGLGEQHLVRRHAAFPAWDPIEVDLRADAAAGRQLGERTGEPGGAEVLHGHDPVEPG